jgi:hypothetical protein
MTTKILGGKINLDKSINKTNKQNHTESESTTKLSSEYFKRPRIIECVEYSSVCGMRQDSKLTLK